MYAGRIGLVTSEVIALLISLGSLLLRAQGEHPQGEIGVGCGKVSVLPRFRDIAGFLLRTAPPLFHPNSHPYSTQILGGSLWTRLPVL